MKHVMLDFETFGKGPNKCVCQVGACYFDSASGEIGKTFKVNIDARSHEKLGGVLDADTVYWWLKQSEQARLSITENLIDVSEAMNALNRFLSEADYIWSHATFDFVTLLNTLHALNIKPLFSYKAGMDLRTLVYLGKVSSSDFVRDGVHHDGLADSVFQVKYAVAALNKIQGSRALINRLKQACDV